MTLFRTGDILMVLLMLGAGFWTYEVKYAAQQRAQEVRGLERKIESERDTADLLRARWALATAPARLERLATQYSAELQLQPIAPRQIAAVAEIPERLPEAIETAIKNDALPPNGRSIGGNDKKSAKELDNIATAAIRRPGGSGGSGGQAPQKKIAAAKISKPESKPNWHKQPPYIMPPAGGFAPAGGGLW